MKLYRLLELLTGEMDFAPGGLRDFNVLMQYEVVVHGKKKAIVERVYSDDTDRTINIDIDETGG